MSSNTFTQPSETAITSSLTGHKNLLIYGSKPIVNQLIDSEANDAFDRDEKQNLEESSEAAKPKSPQTKSATASTLKGQIISFDRFDENEQNFSLISSGLMRIMQGMLAILPDSMVNDILNLLKFESFIMFAMVENF